MKRLTYDMIINEEVKIKVEDFETVLEHIKDGNELEFDDYNRIYNEAGIYIADLEEELQCQTI